MEGHRYFILNKPYNMVSQFVSSHDVPLLHQIDFNFPEGTHAIGRLDCASEGLLLLTTNKKVTRLLFQGKEPHRRKYLIQVKGVVEEKSVENLRNGIVIPIKNGIPYTTQPCEVTIVKHPENLFSSGYELHQNVISTWLEITLTEGKFHQVRKMVFAIGHPCKRLIRVSIEDIGLEKLLPGEVREISEIDFFRQLKIDQY